MEEIALAPSSVYQALGGAQGVMYTGSALASAQAPGDLTLVDDLALLPFRPRPALTRPSSAP